MENRSSRSSSKSQKSQSATESSEDVADQTKSQSSSHDAEAKASEAEVDVPLTMMGEEVAPMTEEEQREETRRKFARSKSRRCKHCLQELMGKREASETRIRANLPYCLVPCLTCFCVSGKMAFYGLLEPFWLLIPIVCVTSVISFFMRLLHCPCGRDLVYSCMEFLLIVDLCIGVYWEVDWWREVERAEKPHEQQV